jgi:hypothetical protein
MFHAELFRDALFEFANERTRIRQPVSLENLVDASQKRLAIVKVRPADMKRLRKGRQSAQTGESRSRRGGSTR